MKTIRERFEEIWPVPAGVFMNPYTGEYDCMPWDSIKCDLYVARLDTFARCQETTEVYVSLVDELIESLTYAKNWVELSSEVAIIENLLRKANKTRNGNK